MANIVSDEQVAHYVDNGYLVAEQLISPEEIAQLQADAVKLARGGYPSETLKPVPADWSDQQVLERVLCIHQPHFVSDMMRSFVTHPKMAAVLGRITGAHLRWWDGAVKSMQSMLFVKPPGFQGQAWHQDEIYIPTRDRSLVGGWIALDDATIDNGCLRVIPGSHRTGYLYPQRDHANDDEFDGAQESYGFDDAGEVPVEVKAGDVVFFNGYLLHRSHKNRSNGYRRVLVNHYMNAWSLLPWLENQGVARTDSRRVVPVHGEDPYAWKGYETDPQDVHMRFCKANRPAASNG
jgi:ectoine hydroxylase-related dioxygenase (phytanoyl-CoA dioxygenase family)